MCGAQSDGAGVQMGEQGLDLGEVAATDPVGLVDHEDVGELDLVDEELRDAALVIVGRCQVAVGESVSGGELVEDRGGVDDGDRGVELGDVPEARTILASVGEGGGDRHRFADPGGLDHEVVEAALCREAGDLDDEILSQGAADAAVGHLDELFVGAQDVGAAQQHRVDVDLAHVVDDHGDPQLVAVGEHVAEQAGLARAEEP